MVFFWLFGWWVVWVVGEIFKKRLSCGRPCGKELPFLSGPSSPQNFHQIVFGKSQNVFRIVSEYFQGYSGYEERLWSPLEQGALPLKWPLHHLQLSSKMFIKLFREKSFPIWKICSTNVWLLALMLFITLIKFFLSSKIQSQLNLDKSSHSMPSDREKMDVPAPTGLFRGKKLNTIEKK